MESDYFNSQNDAGFGMKHAIDSAKITTTNFAFINEIVTCKAIHFRGWETQLSRGMNPKIGPEILLQARLNHLPNIATHTENFKLQAHTVLIIGF